jgi:hypothetical protein
MDLACFGRPLSGLSSKLNTWDFVSVAMVECLLVKCSIASTGLIAIR